MASGCLCLYLEALGSRNAWTFEGQHVASLQGFAEKIVGQRGRLVCGCVLINPGKTAADHEARCPRHA